jgi:hypothetical protein
MSELGKSFWLLGYFVPLFQFNLKLPLSISSSKRGIDFGLGRGFSGSQAAKHFMGMAAASFSGGPGRKRKRADHDSASFQYPGF